MIRYLFKETSKYEYKMNPETEEMNDRLHGKKWNIRYYKMTKEEFEEAKKFCFYIIVEDEINKILFVEIFCYDVRTLLHERMFRLDLSTRFIPIPVSPERWSKLIK